MLAEEEPDLALCADCPSNATCELYRTLQARRAKLIAKDVLAVPVDVLPWPTTLSEQIKWLLMLLDVPGSAGVLLPAGKFSVEDVFELAFNRLMVAADTADTWQHAERVRKLRTSIYYSGYVALHGRLTRQYQLPLLTF